MGKNGPAVGLLGGGDRRGRLMGRLREERFGEGKGKSEGELLAGFWFFLL
jgi:hypothetical protein